MADGGVEREAKWTQKELRRSLKRGKVDGARFLFKFQNDGDDEERFGAWFNGNLCAPKRGQNGLHSSEHEVERKYGHFGRWLMAEMRLNGDCSAIGTKDGVEFTEFVVNGFDEFIGHILVELAVDGQMLGDRGPKHVAQLIVDRYNLPKGPARNLCHKLDDLMRTKKAHRGRPRTAHWMTAQSKRPLAYSPDSGSVLMPLISLSLSLFVDLWLLTAP